MNAAPGSTCADTNLDPGIIEATGGDSRRYSLLPRRVPLCCQCRWSWSWSWSLFLDGGKGRQEESPWKQATCDGRLDDSRIRMLRCDTRDGRQVMAVVQQSHSTHGPDGWRVQRQIDLSTDLPTYLPTGSPEQSPAASCRIGNFISFAQCRPCAGQTRAPHTRRPMARIVCFLFGSCVEGACAQFRLPHNDKMTLSLAPPDGRFASTPSLSTKSTGCLCSPVTLLHPIRDRNPHHHLRHLAHPLGKYFKKQPIITS
ncbi:hypothetical protein IWX50DRAFT_187462 [Phyllosticta citricarpa]|uniref:Uncharacterized protein n=1 Tax=Phyllosticta citricarpa TaxID=55181 RepID=A0ABR1MHW8_9PEZI